MSGRQTHAMFAMFDIPERKSAGMAPRLHLPLGHIPASPLLTHQLIIDVFRYRETQQMLERWITSSVKSGAEIRAVLEKGHV